MNASPESLELGLKAIAEPNRLDILRQLQEPLTIDGVELTPSKVGQGADTRQLTREAIRHHLTVLSDLGLVRVGRRRRDDGRLVNEFRADPRGLYHLLEELREVCAQLDTPDDGPHEAMPLPDEHALELPPLPRLIVLHGLRPGKAFPLRSADLKPPRGWVIGSSTRASVPLAHDPYLSPEDAEILHGPDGYEVLDLRGSKNGTFVNGKQVPLGGAVKLHHGDVIRVGRSWLVFQCDRTNGAF